MKTCENLENKLISLTRTVNDKQRYYNLNFQINLFEDYLLEIMYGNVNYKSPTRVIKKIFSNENDLLLFIKKLISKKLNKGYIIKYNSKIY